MQNSFFHHVVASIAVVLTIVLSVEAQNQSRPSRDDQALTALVQQMTDAQSKFDTATLERIYASDFIEVSPIGEVDARAKTIGFYKPDANPESAKTNPTITTDEFSIRTYDGFAVVITRITFTQAGTEPSPRPPFSMRATLVCRKEKGAWKISSAQYTGIRPPRPQQTK